MFISFDRYGMFTLFYAKCKMERHQVGCQKSKNTVQQPGESKCEHCGKYVRHLHDHIRLNHGTESQCEECGKAFKSKTSLETHISNSHSIEKHFCDKCAKTFSSKSGLNRHISTYHEGLYCLIYLKMFSLPYFLN